MSRAETWIQLNDRCHLFCAGCYRSIKRLAYSLSFHFRGNMISHHRSSLNHGLHVVNLKTTVVTRKLDNWKRPFMDELRWLPKMVQKSVERRWDKDLWSLPGAEYPYLLVSTAESRRNGKQTSIVSHSSSVDSGGPNGSCVGVDVAPSL